MNIAVEILKRFAAMADHRMRESRQGFLRNFDRTGREKLVVRDHRKTFNSESIRSKLFNVQPFAF